MPPNFICFFLSFLSTLPAKKTRDFLGSAQKPRELEKGGEAKKSRKRGTGRLIKIEKRDVPLFSLFSLLSLLSRRENRRMGENTNKKQQDGIVVHSHYFSIDCFR
jgi:hypothetical protein